MSAESGVPTFRDALEGLWARFRPEELATPEAFAADPGLVWRWYQWRRNLVAESRPNAGHIALARLAEAIPALRLITQNVDGLHQQAGSRDVIELHGNLFVNRCSTEGAAVTIPSDTATDNDDGPPPCPRCGAPVRPGVVWFGESLPLDALREAESLAAGCDLFLSVGTSAMVMPAAGLALSALQAGAALVEINPEGTALTPRADYVVQAPSGEALPYLYEQLIAYRHQENTCD